MSTPETPTAPIATAPIATAPIAPASPAPAPTTVVAARRDSVYRNVVPGLGELSLRRLAIPGDVPVIHDWINRAYARYWGMGGTSLDELADAYREIVRPDHAHAWLGLHDGEPAFLVETYRPDRHELAEHYHARPGDRGMHILVAPAEERIPRFTWHVFTTVLDFLFADPEAERIVVEPDVRNEKIHRLNRRAGFVYQRRLRLPDKEAWLAFLGRRDYAEARRRREEAGAVHVPAQDEVHHLDAERWAAANREMVAKAIAELSHELVLDPQADPRAGANGEATDEAALAAFRLEGDEPGVSYRFRARRLHLDHWSVEAASIERLGPDGPGPVDALVFLRDMRSRLGMDAVTLPVYLEEISSTLSAAAFKRSDSAPTAAELARAEFQEIESAMTEGHPCFLANSGRIGFDAADYRAYAPETGRPVSLVWLAAHRERATFVAIPPLEHRELMVRELGAETVDAFESTLRDRGLDPADYLFLPAHPWQWSNKLVTVFAGDLAARKLVYLGRTDQRHLPQQSIRTLLNAGDPALCYVKTALSILNMGFTRGLSPYYMRTTPPINQWIHELVSGDPYLRSKGFTILREVATVGYRNLAFEAAVEGESAYKKMLAALWRESPCGDLEPGERLMTMAALLHRDRHGAALVAELIRLSPVAAEDWLRRYLDAYLAPLLHCFFAHDLVFMPHGENLILVLDEDGVPQRAIMKDIAEEVGILNTEAELPEAVRRLQVAVPEDLKILAIFTDVFDCFFRFLAEILHVSGTCSQDRFWELVAECVIGYQEDHPEQAEKFARHDLFVPEFRRSCLNRLQLANNRQLIDLADPAKNLQFAGTLRNPIAEHPARG